MIPFLLSRISMPVLAAAAVIVFYEGVPIINAIPFVDRIPVIGELAVGRVGRARQEGVIRERVTWQERMRRAEVKQREKRRETQATLDAIELQYLQSQALITALQASNEGITYADYLCSGPAISERLSERIDAAGR